MATDGAVVQKGAREVDALHVVENVGSESVLLATHGALTLAAVLGLLDVLQQDLPGPWRHSRCRTRSTSTGQSSGLQI